jgi:hypothetical protein
MNSALACFDDDLSAARLGNEPEVIDEVKIPFAVQFRPYVSGPGLGTGAAAAQAENHAVAGTKGLCGIKERH